MELKLNNLWYYNPWLTNPKEKNEFIGIPNVSQVHAFGSPCLELSTFGCSFLFGVIFGISIFYQNCIYLMYTLQTMHAMSKSKTKINLPFVYMKLLGFISKVIFTNVWRFGKNYMSKSMIKWFTKCVATLK
jgi:hypothetical protein